MSLLSSRSLSLSLLALVASIASAQSMVDGVRGSEWTGLTPTASVAYNAAAPNSNFGAPTAENDRVDYDIYLRSDADYVYALLETRPEGAGLDAYDSMPGAFANLYFDTDYMTASGSDLGFEVGAGGINAFRPGGANFGSALSYGLVAAVTSGTTYANGGTAAVIELAIPNSYFLNDPQNVGFNTVDLGDSVRLNLSQSFSYSVAGGTSYGAARLGLVQVGQPVPEPATLAALGLGGLALLRRRRASK